MDRKVLFIGGVFAEENINEVASKAIGTVEYSANIFQERLIKGFQSNNIDISVVSAPFIGAYPTRSKIIYFSGFKNIQNRYKYVPFLNIWGIRHFSIASSLKKAIYNFAFDYFEGQKLIIVYSAHGPFLEAAMWAKKKDPSIKVCFVSPDLPEYMNLDNSRSKVYDLLKKVDISRMNKLIEQVDTFVLLTEHMKERFHVNERPALVVEGIIEKIENISMKEEQKNDDIKYIVYTGKLNEKFGVRKLIGSFLEFPDIQYRLVLVGDGDCVPYINEIAKKDCRIIYTGQVTPQEAKNWQQKADVLINPRMNNEEYTKYSFPSKTIEYLMTGKPVVAYWLDGMKKKYREFLYIIPENKKNAEMETIVQAINDEYKLDKYSKFRKYAEINLRADSIAYQIIRLNKQETNT